MWNRQIRHVALSIFNDIFATFEHPLVDSTRDLLVAKGAKVVKGRIVNGESSKLEILPRAIEIDKEKRLSGDQATRGRTSRLGCCCSQS